MAYDPQSERRRARPGAGDPAPIDALLDAVEPDDSTADAPAPAPAEPGDRSPGGGPEPSRRRADPAHGADPPPPVSVTPGPADPWSDRQLVRAVVASVVLTLTGAIAARWLWQRLRAARR